MRKFPWLLRGEAVPRSLWSQVPTVISRVGARFALPVRDRGPNAGANENGTFCLFYFFRWIGFTAMLKPQLSLVISVCDNCQPLLCPKSNLRAKV